MNRILKIAAVQAAVILIATGAYAAPEDAFGTWQHPDNGSLVQLYACGDGLCAKIVKTKDPAAKDEKNPDPAKRGIPVAGLVIMNGAKKSGDSGWKGDLYNREDGGTYSGTVSVVSKTQLKLEGCGLAGLVCRAVTWTRVSN